MRIAASPAFWTWRTSLDATKKAALDDALAYLAQFGQAAALPYVRHRIQTSRHYPDMSEVRVLVDGRHLRALVSFEGNNTILLLVGGDKTTTGNDWYLQAIPAADDIIDNYRTHNQGPRP